MVIILRRKSSLCLTALLTVLLEFTFVDKSISNQKICDKRDTGSISYFKLDDEAVDWNQARIRCNNRSSILPVICNQHEQDDLTKFLKDKIGSSAAWTSGRKINFTSWKWIDGQTFNGDIQVAHEGYTHAVLHRVESYTALHPSNRCYYLCQNSGSSCNSENVINVTKGCVIPNFDDVSWYDARNQCLKNASDLAILTDADLVTLAESHKLDSIYGYWIGLRKNTWQWMLQGTLPSGEEIEYSNWSGDDYSLNGECISVDASNGEWKAVRCTEKKKVVCQGNDTSSKPMPSRPTSESTTQTMNEGHSCAHSQVLLMTVVIVGLCVIVISNIVVALVVRKYYLRPANALSNIEATVTKRYPDLETTRGQANPDGTYTDLQLQTSL